MQLLNMTEIEIFITNVNQIERWFQQQSHMIIKIDFHFNSPTVTTNEQKLMINCLRLHEY